VFYVDANGQFDPISALIINTCRVLACIVLFGGPLWAIWMIPDYLRFWQRQPEIAAGVTQCFLAFFAPLFLGTARVYRILNLQGYKTSNSVFQIACLVLGAIGMIGFLGLLIWDLTRLNDFLAYRQRDPAGAAMAVAVVAASLLGGLISGWYFGRSRDAELNHFRQLVRSELERRSQ
jgi:hypothetical protein